MKIINYERMHVRRSCVGRLALPQVRVLRRQFGVHVSKLIGVGGRPGLECDSDADQAKTGQRHEGLRQAKGGSE